MNVRARRRLGRGLATALAFVMATGAGPGRAGLGCYDGWIGEAAAADPGAKVRARLAEGKKLYDEQEYRKAIRELAPVARDPAATRAQRLKALELLGLCWFILGAEAEARDAFEDLLAIDPGYQLREVTGSPKIEAFFAEVKKAYVPDAGAQGVLLEHAAPAGGSAGRRLELEARVERGGDLVKDVLVRWRRQGELTFRDVTMNRGSEKGGASDGDAGSANGADAGQSWRARFTPPGDAQGYVLEYYLEARDLGGRAVARVGGPESPLTLQLGAGRGGDERAWYGRWYVWAGGVVVLGAAATAIAIAASGEGAPEGTLGTVELP
jgi:hypothetical protein